MIKIYNEEKFLKIIIFLKNEDDFKHFITLAFGSNHLWIVESCFMNI